MCLLEKGWLRGLNELHYSSIWPENSCPLSPVLDDCCALKQIRTLAWAIRKYMTLSQLLNLSELEF